MKPIDAARRTIVPGTTAKPVVTAQRIAPALGDAVARQRIKRGYQGPPRQLSGPR